MATVDVLPDVEEMVIEHLTGHPLLAGFAGLRVSTDLHADRPAVTVMRSGGTPADRRRLDNPTVDIHAWHDDRASAQRLVQTARAAVHDMEGRRYTVGAVTGVRDGTGPIWVPDPDTHEARWVCSLDIYASPLLT